MTKALIHLAGLSGGYFCTISSIPERPSSIQSTTRYQKSALVQYVAVSFGSIIHGTILQLITQ